MGRRPPFVGVVAVHKGGTNLMAEMMSAFGYQVMGMGVVSDVPAPGPELSWEERERQYISAAPPYSCYFTHSLPVRNGDDIRHRPLLTQWCREPFPLIFIYRDPRAVLCSFVHYVLKEGKSQEFTSTPFAMVYSSVLGNIADAHARTRVAIECLQQYFTRSFREHVWLLHHPAVHQTSYERLVGPDGEGDETAQIKEVAAAMAYLNVEGDPAETARLLYNRHARTFVRGRAQGWRDELGPEHLRDFNRLYADILTAYGYPVVEC